MKHFAALISIFLVLFALSPIANADEQSQTLLPLSNKSLVSILQYSGYKDWCFYQPAARETDTNTSSERYLDGISAYPIIACRDNDICLIVLKKINSQWNISITNDQALAHDRFLFKTFSIDENYSNINLMQSVYFDFEDALEDTLTLSLQLSDVYPSYFSSVRYKNMCMILNYDRGITVQYDYPFLCRVSYEINPEPSIPFNADAFSFSNLPLAIEEFFVPSTVSPQDEAAGLFAFPDDSMEPVFLLNRGETIDIIRQQSLTDWLLAHYKGNLYFIRKNDVIMRSESYPNIQ